MRKKNIIVSFLSVKIFIFLIKNFIRVSIVSLQYKKIREFLVNFLENILNKKVGTTQKVRRPKMVIQDQKLMTVALLYSIKRACDNGCIKPKTINKIFEIFISQGLLRTENKEFYKKYKRYPPYFLTISPTKACQLRCKGCYAESDSFNEYSSLDYDIFSRIIKEAKSYWNSHFFVISGGEPFLYKNKNKTLLNILDENQDCFFLVYTNGLLLDDNIVKALAELGNLTPAISVEGLKDQTDNRRGKGTFDNILKVMQRLKKNGVPFGISITATRKNVDEITSDEFISLFFDKLSASYAWIFHYMPIGREINFDLMITPEQRVNLYKKTWQIVKEKKIFMVDFWNHGSVSNGCISAGRPTGYLYINWHGDVTPCVFIPYSPVNIIDLYNQGKDLNSVLEHPFFKEIRTWQSKYGYDVDNPKEYKNWLMPCPIRDHYLFFKGLLDKYKPKPIDEGAKCALQNPDYCKNMVNFDKQLAKLTTGIWQKEYIEKED